jgi:hypothetical protein
MAGSPKHPAAPDHALRTKLEARYGGQGQAQRSEAGSEDACRCLRREETRQRPVGFRCARRTPASPSDAATALGTGRRLHPKWQPRRPAVGKLLRAPRRRNVAIVWLYYCRRGREAAVTQREAEVATSAGAACAGRPHPSHPYGAQVGGTMPSSQYMYVTAESALVCGARRVLCAHPASLAGSDPSRLRLQPSQSAMHACCCGRA